MKESDIDALRRLLDLARTGRVVGIAWVAVMLVGCSTAPITDAERNQNERTIEALRLLDARYNRQPAQVVPQRQATAFLKGSYVSGMNRICIYDRLGSEVAITLRSVDICPLSQ